ncbi:MAG TPA: metallophosphoesterase family protein [Gemmataceae bacterium]|nr:metallophosphoesterase family protein [Gemmataceae bacterium]
MFSRIAAFGGVYNNYLALEAALHDIRRRGADAVFCLGDLGAFGPHPDRVFPLLHDYGVLCIQGNYDNSVGNGLADCQCGYTDPRDNHFARISYEYTFSRTSPANRDWLRGLPAQRRVQLGRHRVLMCHGSPRRVNEFLWESTTPTHFLDHLATAHDADVILATHTGIKWHRPLTPVPLPHGGRGVFVPPPPVGEGNRGEGASRHFVNVGVLGRPENDGRTCVWYTLLEAGPEFRVEFVPVEYDHHRLAREMREERLPEEFIETVLTGWWTTCLEVLPGKERRRGRW